MQLQTISTWLNIYNPQFGMEKKKKKDPNTNIT